MDAAEPLRYPKALTAAQSRELDRLAAERLGLPGVVLMENAGLNAANAIMDLLDAERQLPPFEARVAIFCGGGNNGGDGYVVARHLHNWGADVKIFATKPVDDLTGDAAVNARVCRNMHLPIRLLDSDAAIRDATGEAGTFCHAVVDALLGTGFTGDVREPLATLIARLDESSGGPLRIALDCPSGLNADTGRPANVALHADMTVTFASEKVGYRHPDAAAYLGRLVVADIGIPNGLIDQVLGIL